MAGIPTLRTMCAAPRSSRRRAFTMWTLEPAAASGAWGGPSEQGYLHCGPSGSGHFVKMVHNGIEYGLMQAYAEGFDILKHANSPEVAEEHRFQFDLTEIAEVWRRGSVV